MSFVVGAVSLTMTAGALADTAIEAPGPFGPLKGTLVAVATDAPVVLIIPGSGPTDRNGNNPLGVKGSPFRLLAEGLASSGISSVRIDKRGMFGSAAAIPDANAVTISDYANDVAAWIASIRSVTKRDCVWLLGHSEGGLVALVAAQKVDRVCGLLLVATAGRPLSDVLTAQLTANPANAPILPQAIAAIEQLRAGSRVDTTAMHPALLPLFRPQVQGFLIDAFSFDPAALVRAYDGPVQVLQGARDIQVGVADAELLAGARPGVRLTVLSDVNHVLKSVASDGRASNLATYADPDLPLADAVVPAISAFVKQNGK